MARVTGNVLGNLRGRLGNLSARTVNGQTILSARPESFTLSQTPESIQARKKFGVTGSFSKFIAEVQMLNEIWAKVKLPGISVFNTMFKKNYPFSSTSNPTIDNIITPGGFGIPVTSAVVSENDVSLELAALNTNAVFSADEVDLSIATLVMYYNPINPEDDAFKVIKLTKDQAAYDFSTSYTATLNLDVVQKQVAAKYLNSIMYLAVASKTSDGKIVQYSATYSQEN